MVMASGRSVRADQWRRRTTCGGPWITRAKCWKFSSRNGRDRAAALKFYEANVEALRQAKGHRDGQASLISSRHEDHRKCRIPGVRSVAQQSGRKFTSAVPATRASDGQIQKRKVAAEIRLDPLFNPQSFQPGTSLLLTPRFQTQPHHCLGRVAPTGSLRFVHFKALLTNSNFSDNAPRYPSARGRSFVGSYTGPPRTTARRRSPRISA